jgi:hypothetical protein
MGLGRVVRAFRAAGINAKAEPSAQGARWIVNGGCLPSSTSGIGYCISGPGWASRSLLRTGLSSSQASTLVRLSALALFEVVRGGQLTGSIAGRLSGRALRRVGLVAMDVADCRPGDSSDGLTIDGDSESVPVRGDGGDLAGVDQADMYPLGGDHDLAPL